MEISILAEDLRKVKLFVATPMYGGQCFGMYTKAALDLQMICAHRGIEVKFSFLFNESLITRARNYMVDEFLRSGFTHMLFIDSDINFNPEDILTLIALDKDIIGGPYPKKSINWGAIWKGCKKVLAQPNFDESKWNPGELEGLAGDYVFNPVPGTKEFRVTEPLEVMEIGTGFMMIKRSVFLKFKDEFPHLSYKPDHIGQPNFDGSRYIHAFFDTVIDPNTHRYLSEDYMFCLAGNQLVETEFGLMSIKKLVESKYSGKVKSIDSKGKFVWNNVVNHSKVKNKGKTWVKLQSYTSNNRKSKLTCTSDHRVMCFDDWKNPLPYYTEAKNLKEKFVIRGVQCLENALYSKEQLEFLVGSLLGDGTISRTGQILFTHCGHQFEYNSLKQNIFKGKLNQYKNDGRGFGRKDNEYSVVHLPVNIQTKELRKLMYADGKKTLKNVLSLVTERALAFLYMDDGYIRNCGKGGCSLHTESFSIEDNILLQNHIQMKFGICCEMKTRVVAGKEFQYLWFDSKNTDKLHSLIYPYIIDSLSYKLRPQFRELSGEYDYTNLNCLEYSAEKIKEIQTVKDQKWLYDIEVEKDHNFMVSNTIVHNCQYWRSIGGKIWLCPWMKTTHIGTYGFQGDMPKIAAITGSL